MVLGVESEVLVVELVILAVELEDFLVPVVEFIVLAVELEDFVVLTLELVVLAVVLVEELESEFLLAELVGLVEGERTLEPEVAPHAAREWPLGQQPASVQ